MTKIQLCEDRLVIDASQSCSEIGRSMKGVLLVGHVSRFKEAHLLSNQQKGDTAFDVRWEFPLLLCAHLSPVGVRQQVVQ